MKQESGRSMVEMVGVLAIMGVITAGAVLLITRGMGMQKQSQVNEDVSYMVTRVREIHGQFDDFSGLNSRTIFNAIGMTAKNPYGGAYEISADPSNPRQFIVKITGLDSGECDLFTSRAWSDSVGYHTSGGRQSGATGDCNRGAGKNTVQITFGE